MSTNPTSYAGHDSEETGHGVLQRSSRTYRPSDNGVLPEQGGRGDFVFDAAPRDSANGAHLQKTSTFKQPKIISQISGMLGLNRTTTMEHRQAVHVALKAFPVEVQHILAPFDHDRDGLLDANELEEAANAFIQSRQHVRKLIRAFIVFLVVMCILCGALGGIIFAVVHLTRQLDVAQGDVLTPKGSTNPVKVTATNNLQTSTLSSNLPNDVLNQMRFLQITSPTGAELNLAVTGTARIPTNIPPYGSVVHLYLGSLGYARLVGDVIQFDENVDTIFQEAGLNLVVTPTGRRLLANGNANGIFNLIRNPTPVSVYKSPDPKPVRNAPQSADTLIAVLNTTAGYTNFTCKEITQLNRYSRDGSPIGVFKVPNANANSKAVQNAIDRVLADCPEVEAITPDLQLEETQSYVHDEAEAEIHGPGRRLLQTAVADPNDVLYTDSGMWGHVYANMLTAWSYTYGSPNVPVCIIDNGLTAAHEDLSTQLWVNTKEIAGNKIDDDGDGIVDDVNGARIITASNLKDNNIADEDGHGTHVSGILGAAVNNAKGIAGVAPKSKIMSCKCATATAGCSTADMANCINYCYARGARIFSASQGGCTTLSSAISTMSAVFTKYPDAVFFFSAGNNGLQIPESTGCGFPGRINATNVFNVGATNWNYVQSSFSNYGASLVELGAPGEYILSTKMGGGYEYRSGTSMAAPFAAGIAALMKAYNKNLTPTQIRAALLASCDLITGGSTAFECGGQLDGQKALAYVAKNYGIALA